MYQTSVWKLVKSEPLARAAIAIPALGTLLGSAFMAMGGILPCIIMDAVGLVLALIILISLVLKYLWIEHMLVDGDETEGKVILVKDNPGLALAQTTELEYHYSYDGVKYTKRVIVHLPENEHLNSATIVVDPDHPDSSIIKELYCVPV